MSVPSNQTLILKGFKDHADYRNVITFLKELGVMAGCMFINPSSIVPDAYNKDDGGQIAYVNYHSPAAAARSLQKCQRYAAQLDQGTAKQYGFLARLTVGCKDRNVTAASDSDEGESLCEHLERLLRGAPGGIDGVQVESIARERGEWQDEVNDAGGVKTFVQAHCAARLEWYFSTVRLLATPSQNQGAAGGQQRAATSVPESEAATLCQHLEGLLRDTPGGLHAPQVGFIARERGEWQVLRKRTPPT
ncbi:hypothetical protein T484DRAFT_3029226 [Baffinella frigidus]|nr:hypothetical protein T484DRAFT_3029226 [Cryptophyta sp. CCMP2293]